MKKLSLAIGTLALAAAATLAMADPGGTVRHGHGTPDAPQAPDPDPAQGPAVPVATVPAQVQAPATAAVAAMACAAVGRAWRC